MTPNGLFDSKALLALNSLLLKMTPYIVPIDAASAIHVHCAGNLPPCLHSTVTGETLRVKLTPKAFFSKLTNSGK